MSGSAFMLRTDEPLSSTQWQVAAVVFGIISSWLFFYVLFTVCTREKRFWRTLAGVFLGLGMLARSMFYFVDPYYTRKIVPTYVSSVLYGIHYPCLNTAQFVVLDAMLEGLKVSMEEQTKLRDAKRLGGILFATRPSCIILSIIEFGLQICVDVRRVTRPGATWYVTAEALYIFYALILSVGFTYLYNEAGLPLFHMAQDKLKGLRFLALWLGFSGFCNAILFSAAVILHFTTSLGQDAYFWIVVVLQIPQCGLVLLTTLAMRLDDTNGTVASYLKGLNISKQEYSRRMKSIIYGKNGPIDSSNKAIPISSNKASVSMANTNRQSGYPSAMFAEHKSTEVTRRKSELWRRRVSKVDVNSIRFSPAKVTEVLPAEDNVINPEKSPEHRGEFSDELVVWHNHNRIYGQGLDTAQRPALPQRISNLIRPEDLTSPEAEAPASSSSIKQRYS